MTDRPAPIALVDRAWAGLWTAMMVSHVEAPSLDVARDVVRAVVLGSPGTPYGATLHPRGSRWVPVAADALEAHLERVVVAVEDPDADDADRFIGELTRRHPVDLPFVLWVGPHTVAYTGSHVLGDAATDAVLLRAVIDGDADAVLRMPRVDAAMLRRAATAQTRLHHREWARLAVGRLAPRAGRPVPSATPPAAGAVLSTAEGRPPRTSESIGAAGLAPAGTAIVSVVLSNTDMRLVSQWRNARAKGASITAVMASLLVRSLDEAGVAVDTSGFFTLVDLRRYLVDQPEGSFPGGNLAKAVRLVCDLSDPVAVDAALSEVVASGRPLAATVLGAGLSLVTPPAGPGPARGGPLALTYNSIPGLPGASGLPWVDGVPGRYVGAGFPVGGDGLSVVALRLREHMEMAASIAPGTVDPGLVRHLLTALPAFAAGDLARGSR